MTFLFLFAVSESISLFLMIFFSLCSDIHHLALHLHHLQSPHAVFVQQPPHTHTHNLQLLFSVFMFQLHALHVLFSILQLSRLSFSISVPHYYGPVLLVISVSIPPLSPPFYHADFPTIFISQQHNTQHNASFSSAYTPSLPIPDSSTQPLHATPFIFSSGLCLFQSNPLPSFFLCFRLPLSIPFHFVRVCTVRRYGYVRADLLLLESSSSSLLVHTCMHRPLRLLRVIDRLWNFSVLILDVGRTAAVAAVSNYGKVR